jgi:predicted ATPase
MSTRASTRADAEHRYVGRHAALAEARLALAAGCRLLTVTGAPGIGKTRFARSLLRLVCGEFPGGTWSCDLLDVDSAPACAAQVGRLVGVAAVGDTATRLESALAARGRALLVLDNFEALVASSAADVVHWLDVAPDLHVIVTSRAALCVSGERRLELSPLTPGEAAVLFADSVGPSEIASEVLALRSCAAKQLVACLDGIPRVIEVVASRARSSRRPLRSQVADLAVGTWMASDLNRSWRLLSNDDRNALAQCAVFCGGFDAVAVEHVVALPVAGHGALDSLQRLVDQSLVCRDGTRAGALRMRFSMLEAVRAYAAGRLALTGEARAAEARHARYFAELSARIERVDAPAGLADTLRAGRANVVAAFERVLADSTLVPDPGRTLADLCAGFDPSYLGDLPESTLQLVARAVQLLDDDRTEAGVRCRLLTLYARALGVDRRQDEAVDALERACTLAPRAGDPRLEAIACISAGRLAMVRGDYQTALDKLAAAEVAERVGPLPIAVHGYRWSAHCAYWLGDLPRARRNSEAALSLARTSEDVTLQQIALACNGALLHDTGDLDAAETLYAECVALDGALAAPTTFSWSARLRRASLARDRGDLRRAEREHRDVLRMFEDASDTQFEGETRYSASLVYLAAGDADAACEQLERARSAMMFDGCMAGLLLGIAAAAHALAGRRDAAAASLGQAEASQARTSATPLIRMIIELARAYVRLAAAPHDRAARTAAEHAVAAARRTQPLGDESRLLCTLIGAALERGALVVGPRGDWVRLPDGTSVTVQSRSLLGALFAALATARRDGRAAVPRDELIAAGWPDERIAPEAASNRLRVALSKLRALGLGNLIQHRADGYTIDPDVPVTFVS